MASVSSSADELQGEEDYDEMLPTLPYTTSATINPARSFKQPFLESYFPPLAPSDPSQSGENHRIDALASSSSRKIVKKGQKPSTANTTAPPFDDSNMKTAIMLKNRDLEIYVTLPSAEKRLFVDVQEEINLQGFSPHRLKRVKIDSHKGESEKVKDSSSAAIKPAASASSSRLATSSSSINNKVGSVPAKPAPSPLGAKDPNVFTSSTSSIADAASTTSKDAAKVIATGPPKPKQAFSSVPRLPYATFEHVKLNVRVKPPLVKREQASRKPTSGVTVAALPKPIVDRFPIRIIGSTTRPTAQVGLQDTFELSVQGCTEIASVLVLLYTRIKLSNSRSFSSLELNAIRLWHLDEDRLIRLSSGNIASNNITPKSILCYTIGRKTGKSFVSVYADPSKIDKVEVDVELSRAWQCKDKPDDLEETKPANAPRRQLFKFKHDLHGTSSTNKRNHKPYSTTFTFPLLGELNCSDTPLEIALEQARKDHNEKVAERKRLREAKEEEDARLEKERKKAQKKKKKLTADNVLDGNLASDGLTAVRTLPEASASTSTGQRGGAPSLDTSGESEFDSEGFVEEWNEDDNNHLSDGCDDEMPFLPYYHGLDMKDSVLLSNLACDNTPGRPFTEEDQSVDATELRVVLIRDGIEHILSSLGIPSSARQPFIRDMVKAVSVYPYVAVKLIRYEDLVHAVNIEARYGPKEEEGTYWDIRDIQQVCLVYKGVWKSEVEDWKKGCNRLTSVNWAEVALTGAMNKDQTVDEELDSDSNPAGVSASGSSARRVVTRSLAATLAANAATTTTTVASALPISEDPLPAVPNSAAPTLNTGTTATTQMPVKVALNPEQRFDEYRARTLHRRSRICPACDYEYCNHSRFNEEEDCDCGECDGDAESDEFFKYYEGNEGEEEQDSQAGTPGSYDSPSENTASAERGEPKETIASVMVPGHRARVVQCIYMEAF